MSSDLLRPRALLRHLLVLAVAVTCVSLGLWQLDRLAEVRASNALLEARLAAPEADLSDLLAEAGVDIGGSAADGSDLGDLDADAIEALTFRRVQVTGTYLADEEVLQRNREHRGQTGFHVLTPLDLGDGRTLLVRRGWVPAELDSPPVAEAAPPEGEVVLTGILERSVDQPGFGPRDPDEGVLERVFHADTSRLDGQVSGALLPVVLRLVDEQQVALPLGLDEPVLDEANHRSYAVQWFTFAILAVGTYGAWLWSRRQTGGGAGQPTRIQ
jgi:surfeit locus 1 family protein